MQQILILQKQNHVLHLIHHLEVRNLAAVNLAQNQNLQVANHQILALLVHLVLARLVQDTLAADHAITQTITAITTKIIRKNI